MSRGARNTRFSRSARVEMLPLIDVLFLLLAVFLLSIARMVRSYALPVKLPQAATGVQETLPTVLLLSVDANGAYALGGEPASLAAIRHTVTQRVGDDPELQILVHGDERARYGVVSALVDAVREAGGSRVLLISKPKHAEERP